jgi:hypothetical protein
MTNTTNNTTALTSAQIKAAALIADKAAKEQARLEAVEAAKKALIPTLTYTELQEFVKTKNPLTTNAVGNIDTSDIDFTKHLDDFCCEKITRKLGYTACQVIDSTGAIVPHARLVLINKSGTKTATVPAYWAMLYLANSKVEMNSQAEIAVWNDSGVTKKGGYKFNITSSELDAREDL